MRTLISMLLFFTELCIAAPIFNNTITLNEFGTANNNIPTFNPTQRYNSPSTIIRTNDYQNLQLKYQNYATNRSSCRIGAFLISQSANSGDLGPGGPGVTFPSMRFSDPASNPASNINTNNAVSLLIFSSQELSNYGLNLDFEGSKTFQSVILTYSSPILTSTMNGFLIIDYNIAGSCFHDIEYQSLTPIIRGDAFTHLKEITVFKSDGSTQNYNNPTPPNNVALTPGQKFRLKLLNMQTQEEQTWLLYLQPSPSTPSTTYPTIQFAANFNGSGLNILETLNSFNGVIRVAIVQTDPIAFNPLQTNVPQEVQTWSTALGIQTIAATPMSMFMLWPKEFTQKAYTKIMSNVNTKTFLPFCPWFSIFAPLIARTNEKTALNFYHLLADKGLNAFDDGTNMFLTLLSIYMASRYDSEISTYQNTRPYPNYATNATPSSVETVYDNHRDIMLTKAEIDFSTPGEYKWVYEAVKTKSNTTQTQALIVFPAYKTLQGFNPIQEFVIKDAIKGDLLAVSSSPLSSGQTEINFNEVPFPSFFNTRFFPEDLWNKLNSTEQDQLIQLLIEALQVSASKAKLLSIVNPPNYSNSGYSNGKVVSQAAQTVLYGGYFMEKMADGANKETIKNLLFDTVEGLKTVFEKWLIDIQKEIRAQNGGSIPNNFIRNFFVADTAGQGICTDLQGMLTGTATGFGNAEYNDHHFSYGYWLLGAATIVDFENRYKSVYNITSPWIAKMVESATGAGPYKMKRFVDVIWRDTRNPDTEDPNMPFSRHSNFWEGHSTANGWISFPYSNGRNQESLAEDYNCWVNACFYAKVILDVNASYPGALDANDIQGFDTFVTFCTTNISLTATSGNLYYNTSNWPYKDLKYDFNVAVAQQFDSFTDTATFFQIGSPPCQINLDSIIFSNSRLNSFYEEYLQDK